jgi:hypothetical protein
MLSAVFLYPLLERNNLRLADERLIDELAHCEHKSVKTPSRETVTLTISTKLIPAVNQLLKRIFLYYNFRDLLIIICCCVLNSLKICGDILPHRLHYLEGFDGGLNEIN